MSLRTHLRDQHLAALYAAWGEPATYTPPEGSAAQDITVIPAQPDEVQEMFGSTRVHAETTVFMVQVSELSAPAHGGVVVHDGTSYTVKEKPLRADGLRLEWTLNVQKVT